MSSVLVDQRTGARTLVSGHETRTQASAEAVDLGILQGAEIMLVDGHQMACAVGAATQARALGIRVVLDGGSGKNGMEELLFLYGHLNPLQHSSFVSQRLDGVEVGGTESGGESAQ